MSFLFSCSRYVTCLRSVSAVLRRRLRLLARCRSPVGALAGSRQLPRHALVSGLSAASLSCSISRVSQGPIPPCRVRDAECPPLGDSVGCGLHVSMGPGPSALASPAMRHCRPPAGQSNMQRESPSESRAAVLLPSGQVRLVLRIPSGGRIVTPGSRQFQIRGGSNVICYVRLLSGFVGVFVRFIL